MNKGIRKKYLLAGGLLVLMLSVLVAYSNVYSNSFLYDDEFLIQKNQLLRNWDSFFKIFQTSSEGGAGGASSFYRPMQTVLYFIIYQIFGLSTFGFHLLNVTLHALNVCLVFFLLKKLKVSELVSFSTALIWGLLPLHVEAVTYQSATADPLHASFVLGGLIFFLISIDRNISIVMSRVNQTASLLMFVFALLSKESAIVFPALAVVCLFSRAGKERWNFRTYFKTIPLWIAAALYLIARSTILNFNHSFQFYKTSNIYTEHISYRIYTFFATLPNYLKLLILPVDLHMDRKTSVYTALGEPIVLIGFFMSLAVLGFVFWSRGRRKEVLFWGLVWFCVAHFPHTGILLPVNSFFLEHWLYLPSIGLFCGTFSLLQSRQRLLFFLCSVLPVYYGVLTFQQNEIWKTPVSFYENILKFNPTAERALNNVAMAYSDLSNYSKAIEFYNKAISVSDSYAQTRHNLGLALLKTGNAPEAIVNFERAIEINPDFYHSYGILYKYYQQSGSQEKADYYLKKYEETVKKFQL